MSNKLDALKAAFGKQNENQNSANYGEQYPFWQMDDGEQAIIRFLPDQDEDNPLSFLVEKLMHTLHINGQRRSVPCLKMYGEKDCPICALSAKYYKEEDRINGKKYWRNKQHVARALIVKDPLKVEEGEESHEGKVRTITLSFQIYEAINQAFQSGELDEVPFAFEGGCDFIIKKKIVKDGKNEYASYVYSSFARRSTDLDPETVELTDLASLLPAKVEYDELEKLLEADVTGSDVQESTPEKSTDSMEDQLAALKSKTETKEEKTPEDKASDSDVEDEADAILASIMKNR
jgi:hypothetical protein